MMAITCGDITAAGQALDDLEQDDPEQDEQPCAGSEPAGVNDA
ncbi:MULTISPECIES: hypothetical protein [Actinoallomurus]|jgi:hypothetical protein|nr:hypothetical protein [Actinoallomurus sp. NBC_01490]